MSSYILNSVSAPRDEAVESMRLGIWGIDADEPHREALAPGDLVLLYLGAPERHFIGRAELGSAVRRWTPAEARVYSGDASSGVLLAQVEEWDPPVPMSVVLSRLAPNPYARADFEAGVVLITVHEYETVLEVAAGRVRSTG